MGQSTRCNTPSTKISKTTNWQLLSTSASMPNVNLSRLTSAFKRSIRKEIVCCHLTTRKRLSCTVLTRYALPAKARLLRVSARMQPLLRAPRAFQVAFRGSSRIMSQILIELASAINRVTRSISRFQSRNELRHLRINSLIGVCRCLTTSSPVRKAVKVAAVLRERR